MKVPGFYFASGCALMDSLGQKYVEGHDNFRIVVPIYYS
jgi:hypothetical protein